jgi:cellulose synthase (UDP-forming)
LNVIMALIYFSWWFQFSHIGNPVLYALLFIGEVYHIIMAFAFWMTIWPHYKVKPIFLSNTYKPSVDIFITVAGEPVSIVRETVRAARDMDYNNHKVYILNDGFVAKKENWRDIEDLAKEEGVFVITRKTPGGAKAGNINNAMRQTTGEFVVIFDADMVAHRDFLQKTIGYFQDLKVGFVQSPQYYKNHEQNVITQAAWEQQAFFFGPVMRGKDNYNSAFVCGTNVVIRRKALLEAGGVYEKSIAEDFLTSLFIHQKGYSSHYVPQVLAEGLAPEDLLSYFKQQLRWARGSLEVLFGSNPLFKSGLSLGQKIQYLASALHYLSGPIVLIDMLMPLIFLFAGISPVDATTTSFAFYFVPFMYLNLYTLYHVSNGQLSFKAIAFTQSSFTLQLMAIKAVILKENTGFSVTPKEAQSGNFISLAYPHIAYTVIAIIATAVAVWREGVNPSVAANVSWAIFNILLFVPFILSAMNKTKQVEKPLTKLAHV